MEEKKNKKTLYLVLGITLLSVLALGGVYAYFAARVTTNEGAITGRTLDINGSTLTIAATRVDLDPTPEPVSDDLVPANFGVAPTEITTTEVNRALDSKCIGGGYTGCHVWKITATSTTDIPSANIKLNLSLSGVTDKDEWSYVVYRGTDTNSETILSKGLINTTFPSSANTLDIHSGASLTAGTPAIYYVMIYLNNVNSAQNIEHVQVEGQVGPSVTGTDERGIYNGTVTLEAMGGQVKVDFLDRTTPVEFFAYEINNNEVTITGYKSSIATYTVTNQSACESYFVNSWDCGSDTECISDVTTYCSGGSVEGMMILGDAIAEGFIPSSDYEAAGLSNVVITPAPTDVVIPSTIEGYPVTSIYGGVCGGPQIGVQKMCGAFTGNGLTSVEIPSSVTSIGAGAFRNNQLVSVEIPSSVTSIGSAAFDNAFNTSEEVILKIDMTNIPSFIFDNKGITNLILGEHVTTISKSAFAGNQLTSIEIPNGVTSIGDGAFSNNQLTSVEISSSVTTIGGSAFYGNQLTSVEIPSSVTTIGGSAFDGNPLTSITIGNGSASIGECAFGENPPLDEPFASNYSCKKGNM